MKMNYGFDSPKSSIVCWRKNGHSILKIQRGIHFGSIENVEHPNSRNTLAFPRLPHDQIFNNTILLSPELYGYAKYQLFLITATSSILTCKNPSRQKNRQTDGHRNKLNKSFKKKQNKTKSDNPVTRHERCRSDGNCDRSTCGTFLDLAPPAGHLLRCGRRKTRSEKRPSHSPRNATGRMGWVVRSSALVNIHSVVGSTRF